MRTEKKHAFLGVGGMNVRSVSIRLIIANVAHPAQLIKDHLLGKSYGPPSSPKGERRVCTSRRTLDVFSYDETQSSLSQQQMRVFAVMASTSSERKLALSCITLK